MSSKLSKAELISTRTLRFSVWEGVCFGIMLGSSELFIGAFGVFLKGTELQIGLLATLPLLFGALAQVGAVRALEAGWRRRTLLVIGSALQASICLVIGSLPWLLGDGVTCVNVLILCVILYFICGHFGNPLWISLMGDVVPPEVRGRFFGFKNLRQGLAAFTCLVCCGFGLEAARRVGYGREAFLTLFSIGFVGRSLSAFLFTKHDDPPVDIDLSNRFTFWQFIRQLPTSNFARFAVFHAVMNFAVMVAGPYLIVYLIRNLGFTYFEYMMVVAATMGSCVAMTKVWGGFCDRYGTKVIFEICCTGIAMVPALWLLGESFWYFIAVQIFAGFCFAGFQLGTLNFILDAVTPGKRGRCTAYLWLLTAPCMIIGSLVGRYLMDLYSTGTSTVDGVPAYAYLALFLTSSVFRGLVAVAMLPGFKEVREVEDWKHRKFIYQIANYSLAGARLDVAVGIFRNGKTHFDRLRFLGRKSAD